MADRGELEGIDGVTDFSDQLDDFMGGSEFSRDGDNELDSFFEDLSTIDDLEINEPESFQTVAIPEPSPKEAPAPIKKKKKGFWKPAFLASLTGMFFGSVAVGVTYYIKKPKPIAVEEVAENHPILDIPSELPPPLEPPPIEPPLVEHQAAPVEVPHTETEKPHKKQTNRSAKHVAATQTRHPKSKATHASTVNTKNFYLQVASCLHRECIEDYTFLLKRLGYYPEVTSTLQSNPMIEIIARQKLQEEEASRWVHRINQENQLTGKAYRKKEGKWHRVSMGLFPDLDTANRVKAHLNQLYHGRITFTAERDEQNMRYSKVTLGPFQNKDEVLAVQKSLSTQDERFKSSFLVKSIYTSEK